jgi:hypothetical protein
MKEVIKTVIDKTIETLNRGWTRGVGARNNSGLQTSPCSPDATSWCLLGALDKSAKELNLAPIVMSLILYSLTEKVQRKKGFQEIWGSHPYLQPPAIFNDFVAKDVEEVISLLEGLK